MNTSGRTLLGAAALGLCLASIGNAQERQPAERVIRPGAAAQADADADGFFKASDLIGMKVKGSGNEDLGTVQDLFIESRTNQIEYLILDTGVLADLGGKQPVVPWVLVEPHFVGDAHFLMVPLTAQRIRTAPTVVLSEIQLGRSAPWIVQVNRFYATDLKERNVSRPDLDANDRDRGDRPGRGDRDDPNRPGTRPAPGERPQPGTPRAEPRPGTEPKPGIEPKPGTEPKPPAEKPQ